MLIRSRRISPRLRRLQVLADRVDVPAGHERRVAGSITGQALSTNSPEARRAQSGLLGDQFLLTALLERQPDGGGVQLSPSHRRRSPSRSAPAVARAPRPSACPGRTTGPAVIRNGPSSAFAISCRSRLPYTLGSRRSSRQAAACQSFFAASPINKTSRASHSASASLDRLHEFDVHRLRVDGAPQLHPAVVGAAPRHRSRRRRSRGAHQHGSRRRSPACRSGVSFKGAPPRAGACSRVHRDTSIIFSISACLLLNPPRGQDIESTTVCKLLLYSCVARWRLATLRHPHPRAGRSDSRGSVRSLRPPGDEPNGRVRSLEEARRALWIPKNSDPEVLRAWGTPTDFQLAVYPVEEAEAPRRVAEFALLRVVKREGHKLVAGDRGTRLRLAEKSNALWIVYGSIVVATDGSLVIESLAVGPAFEDQLSREGDDIAPRDHQPTPPPAQPTSDPRRLR